MKLKLFKRRAVWVPTWPTCLAAVAIFGLLFFWLLSGLHRFLAVTSPAEGAEVRFSFPAGVASTPATR